MAKFKHRETGDEVEYPDGSFYAELAAELPEWRQIAGEKIIVPSAPADDEPVIDPARPERDAHKDEWVAYAIEQGVPSFEAANMTIKQLHKRFITDAKD